MNNQLLNLLVQKSKTRIFLNRFLNYSVIMMITLVLLLNILLIAQLSLGSLPLQHILLASFLILLVLLIIKTFHHPPQARSILASIDHKGKTRGIFSLLFESNKNENKIWQQDIITHAEKQNARIKLSRIFPQKIKNMSYLGAAMAFTALMLFAIPNKVHNSDPLDQALNSNNNDLTIDTEMSQDLSKLVAMNMSQDQINQALKSNPDQEIKSTNELNNIQKPPNKKNKANQNKNAQNPDKKNPTANQSNSIPKENKGKENDTNNSKGSDGAGNQEIKNDKTTLINKIENKGHENKESINLNEDLNADKMANRSTKGVNRLKPNNAESIGSMNNTTKVNIKHYKEYLRPKYQKVIERYFAQEN